MLRDLIRGRKHTNVMYAQHIETHGRKLFKEICRMDLEGIVAKRRDGIYSASAKWVKIKNPNYTQGEGKKELFEKRQSAVNERSVLGGFSHEQDEANQTG